MNKHMELELITYGCGAFDLKKFQPIKSTQWVKPYGGLWASPVNSNYGWKNWCLENSFGSLDSHFIFNYVGNILIIDSHDDLNELPYMNINGLDLECPNFEKLATMYDAILLTEIGQQKTRLSIPRHLYGWDCESVLIMNPNGIQIG